MKDYSWNIKISDLLNNPWETDEIKFKEKYLKNIEIQKPWISWEIFLQWLNHNEILVKLNNIKFTIKYICDKCLQEYPKNYHLENEETVKFVNPQEIKIEEKIYDNIFPIDIKNQIINIENIIEILVKNEEPIVKNCWKHKKLENTNISKNQDENLWYKIDFSKLLKS